MKSPATPAAPKHLTAASKAIWKTIFGDYQIDSAAELMLVATLEARDRREEARAQLAKDGAIQTDRFGQKKPHPSVAIERDAATTMMRGWRLLGFDQEPRGELGRWR
jgi:phage terminase small subunit